MNNPLPEGVTPLSPEEREGLKLTHILTREELNEVEQINISKAYRWVMHAKRVKVNDEMFLKKLHLRMFNDIWRWAGTFRKTDKNIGCSFWEISIQLRNLCRDVDAWIEYQTYDSLEAAARFHHRLVEIHCFPNGNGRHARLATDLLLIKHFKRPPLRWGTSDLNQHNMVRKQYIHALQAADKHDYSVLLEFMRCDRQKAS